MHSHYNLTHPSVCGITMMKYFDRIVKWPAFYTTTTMEDTFVFVSGAYFIEHCNHVFMHAFMHACTLRVDIYRVCVSAFVCLCVCVMCVCVCLYAWMLFKYIHIDTTACRATGNHDLYICSVAAQRGSFVFCFTPLLLNGERDDSRERAGWAREERVIRENILWRHSSVLTAAQGQVHTAPSLDLCQMMSTLSALLREHVICHAWLTDRREPRAVCLQPTALAGPQ